MLTKSHAAAQQNGVHHNQTCTYIRNVQALWDGTPQQVEEEPCTYGHIPDKRVIGAVTIGMVPRVMGGTSGRGASAGAETGARRGAKKLSKGSPTGARVIKASAACTSACQQLHNLWLRMAAVMHLQTCGLSTILKR